MRNLQFDGSLQCRLPAQCDIKQACNSGPYISSILQVFNDSTFSVDNTVLQ